MNNVVKQIQAWFSKLSAGQRRAVYIGGLVLVVVAVAFAALTVGNTVTGGGKTRQKAAVKNVEFYPLTGKDTGSLSQEVMAERVKVLENELTKLRTGEATLGNRGDDPASGQDKAAGANAGQIGNQQGAGADVLPGDIFAPGIVPPPVRKKTAQDDASVKAVMSGNGADSELFPSAQPLPSSGFQGGNNGQMPPGAGGKSSTDAFIGVDGAEQPSGTGRKLQIREISQEEEKDASGNKVSGKNQAAALQEQGIFMPAGTIISGVLITGMDAPTANQSKRDPFPVLLRIKDESILPNRMKMDVRECFLIASGYGDMSSERAYLRADTVSCVRDDGGVIEAGLNAYAVGEDGKNGVRGRLVSKTGSLVAKSLMAGFLAGTADIMKPQKVQPVVNIDQVTGQRIPQLFTDVDPAAVFSQGAMGGVSTGMTRIADYYIEMAKSIFPIIEVDSGRKIDFIVLKGAKLAIQSSSKGNQSGRNQNPKQNQGNQNQVQNRPNNGNNATAGL